MEALDISLGKFIAQAELIGQVCHLNHGPGAERPEAVDYLCQHLGDTKSSWPEVLLAVPICAECAYALLYEPEYWLLFYCLTCHSSQWLIKPKARKYYPKWENLIFLYRCPNCFEE
jgi:hypothetical protein